MTRAAAAMWAGFLLRLAVAVWNGLYGPSLGAEGDAAGFHQIATAYAVSYDPAGFHLGLLYAYALGVVYSFTTNSLLFGSVLSCLAWLLSARTLRKIMRLLSFDRRQQFKAMLVYALLPSSILWTSVTLREAYQLLFVNLAIYASLRIYLRRSTRHWLLLVVAAVGMSVLHGALLAFGVLLIAATAGSVLFRKRHSLPVAKLLVVVPFAVAVLVYGFSTFSSLYSYGVDAGISAAVESYQRGGLSIEARTHYKSDVNIDGPIGFLLFVPVSLFQYLFEPMPWRLGTIGDIGPLLENILRAFLIWKAGTALLKIGPQRRRPILAIFVAYLVMETAWSLGTVNWGTSARHHIPTLGLLVVAAFAASRRKRNSTRSHASPAGSVAHAA